MLVLSRKLGESIVIGDGITVTVAEIRGQCIRLAIEAPCEIPIRRSEILGRQPDEPASAGGGTSRESKFLPEFA